VNLADGAKAGVLLFVAALVQVSLLAQVDILGGTPDLLLVTLVAVAFQRGSIAGAAGGFFGGLIVDTATLETLGLTSLALTIAGYWIGRYGETTGRGRGYAPYLSVVAATVLYALGALVVHFVLGDSTSARVVLVEALAPSIVLNVLLAPPVYALTRRLFPPPAWAAQEVRLLG
jgi:rod shape-determining protein MreD